MDNILENTPNSFLANLSSRLLQQSRVNQQQYLSNSGKKEHLLTSNQMSFVLLFWCCVLNSNQFLIQFPILF